MVDRITINVPTYMELDGQWQIVYPGSVVDVPSHKAFAASSVSATTVGTGTLGSHGKATSSSNVRTR